MNSKTEQILGGIIALLAAGILLYDICMEGFRREVLLYISLIIPCICDVCLVLDGRIQQKRADEQQKNR